jgi:hypothetical protein
MNVVPQRPNFSLVHRDVIPIVAEIDGRADASFALPGRPFSDDDVASLRQKYAVVVDATRYGPPDAEFTFETPFVPRLNEFYGRNFIMSTMRPDHRPDGSTRGPLQSYHRSRRNNYEFGHSEFLIG